MERIQERLSKSILSIGVDGDQDPRVHQPSSRKYKCKGVCLQIHQVV